MEGRSVGLLKGLYFSVISQALFTVALFVIGGLLVLIFRAVA
jgi:hypothetical protein